MNDECIGIGVSIPLATQIKSRPHEKEAILRAVYEVMQNLEKITDPQERILTAMKMIDDCIARQKNLSQFVACKRGCSACCHMQVEILPSEAKLLSEHLNDKRKLRLRGQIGFNAATYYQVPKKRARCVFLDVEREECTVYSIRPLACRKFYMHISADPKDCNKDGDAPFAVLDWAEIIYSAMGNIEPGALPMPEALTQKNP